VAAGSATLQKRRSCSMDRPRALHQRGTSPADLADQGLLVSARGPVARRL
jgi:hypothetical protein